QRLVAPKPSANPAALSLRQFRSGARPRNAVAQSYDTEKAVVAPVVDDWTREIKGEEDLRRLLLAEIEWQPKCRPHDANHHARASVGLRALPEDRSGAAKAPLPQVIADDHHIGSNVVVSEAPSDLGHHAQCLEDVAGDGGRIHAFRLLGSGEVDGRASVRGNVLDTPCLPLIR